MNRFVYIMFLIALTITARAGPADSAANDSVSVDSTSAQSTPETTSVTDSSLSIDSSALEQQSEDSLAAAEEYADTGFQIQSASAADTMHVQKAIQLLYPGISESQDSLARVLIRCIWLFSWDEAEKAGRKMQKLERKEHLPPLSALLVSSACIVRMQNAGFPSKRGENHCLDELNETAQSGLKLSDPSHSPDSVLPTDLLVYGGLKGLLATLQIGRNPIASAVEGLNALSQLEKCTALDSTLSDAYLGLGIFYCALSKASAVVRGALKIIGKTVSLEKGLDYLRRSAYHGTYTRDMAKLYLVEFLSPYVKDQADEKRRILNSFKASYPQNPYFLFLDLEENLCFHPDNAFDPTLRRSVRKKIVSFIDREYSHLRFAALVRWQYVFLDPLAAANLGPDTTFNLGEFSYYPAFLTALREKYLLHQSPGGSAAIYERQIKFIKRNETSAIKALQGSTMNSGWKGFFLWHIRDALKVQ